MQKGHKEFKDQVIERMTALIFSKQMKATRLSPEIFLVLSVTSPQVSIILFLTLT